MKDNTFVIGRKKRIALIAHDSKKKEMLDWAAAHKDMLSRHTLYGTGTTGRMLEKELGIDIKTTQSGPLGGDLEIGALIAGQMIDCLIFFWDPLEAQPHDPDVKALLRIAAVWNIPVAGNSATADFLFSSPLMDQEYQRVIQDYGAYRNRHIILDETEK